MLFFSIPYCLQISWLFHPNISLILIHLYQGFILKISVADTNIGKSRISTTNFVELPKDLPCGIAASCNKTHLLFIFAPENKYSWRAEAG